MNMRYLTLIFTALLMIGLYSCTVEETEVLMHGKIFYEVAEDCFTDEVSEDNRRLALTEFKTTEVFYLFGENIESKMAGIPLGSDVIVEGLLKRDELEVISIMEPVSFLEVPVQNQSVK